MFVPVHAEATESCFGPERVYIGGVMTAKTIRELRDRAPFRPFEIHLADGRSLTVVTADHLLFMPHNHEFLVVLSDGSFHFVDPDQVTTLSPKTAAAGAQTL